MSTKYVFGLEPEIVEEARRLARAIADGEAILSRVSVRRVAVVDDYQRTTLTATVVERLRPERAAEREAAPVEPTPAEVKAALASVGATPIEDDEGDSPQRRGDL